MPGYSRITEICEESRVTLNQPARPILAFEKRFQSTQGSLAVTLRGSEIRARSLGRFRAVEFMMVLILCFWVGRSVLIGGGAAGVSQTPSVAIEFVRIQPGTFQMGCSMGDNRCHANEKPVHTVKITKPFDLGRYEVTQAQWRAVMGTDPSRFKGDARPVEQISWTDAQDFITRLNENGNGQRYRLPTEAEWEYAARAGTSDRGLANAEQLAWFLDNADHETHPVGQKQPNPWGLYDMQGNVLEWCMDWLENYSSGAQSDPTGAAEGAKRVLRGGAFGLDSGILRISQRGGNMPNFRGSNNGFRVVREVRIS